ncbi:NHP2, partial [Enterospora canceri]
MLLKIAEPLADETTSKRILKEVIKADTNLISGIKACTKQITAIESNKSIFVINGTTQPADLVMHLPALCEEHSIPYIFVEDSKW